MFHISSRKIQFCLTSLFRHRVHNISCYRQIWIFKVLIHLCLILHPSKIQLYIFIFHLQYRSPHGYTPKLFIFRLSHFFSQRTCPIVILDQSISKHSDLLFYLQSHLTNPYPVSKSIGFPCMDMNLVFCVDLPDLIKRIKYIFFQYSATQKNLWYTASGISYDSHIKLSGDPLEQIPIGFPVLHDWIPDILLEHTAQ